MGTGWRRAFCTRERRESSPTASAVAPSSEKLARSNPSTPRLRCKTTADENKSQPNITNRFSGSSPRSPFSILKHTVLRFSRRSCGVCTQRLHGHGAAIYTAECSHAFHFPCISSHERRHSPFVCPVCETVWKDVPFLSREDEDEKIIFLDSPAPPKHAPVSTPKFADDEPLRTPKATRPNFDPIPESANDEEKDGEFQGFLVDPISSSDDYFRFNNSRSVELSLMQEAAVISQGRSHDTYAVVLRVKAPPAHVSDAARRAPIDLVTVLDVSGSMTGAKLEMLKRAMRLVISSLGSADRLSVVAFSAAPRRLLPLTRMSASGQRAARRIVDRLCCSGGCSTAEALKQATRVLEERRERNPVASIILLSDGQDDIDVPENSEGNRRRGASHATRFAHVEIPVHSSGFSCEPVEDAFSKCVSGLLSVVVQDLRIQIGFASGSDPAKITAVYSCSERPMLLGSGCIRLGDLYAEEEKELLVEIRVPAAGVGSHHVISAKCCYKDPSNGELVYGRDHALLVPRPLTVQSGLPRIEQLRGAFISSRAVAESRRLIEYCELSSAMQLLSSARALLLQSRSESSDEYAKCLEAEMAEVQQRRDYQRRKAEDIENVGVFVDEKREPLTPASAWKAAEKLAKVAQMKKELNRVNYLHGFENTRF